MSGTGEWSNAASRSSFFVVYGNPGAPEANQERKRVRSETLAKSHTHSPSLTLNLESMNGLEDSGLAGNRQTLCCPWDNSSS